MFNFAILQCDIPKFLNNETKIIETLGNGALGQYKSPGNEKKDVKFLKCDDWDLSGKTFIKEGQIMRKLKHNNVVTIEKNMIKATLFFDGLLFLRFFQVWSRRSSTFV